MTQSLTPPKKSLDAKLTRLLADTGCRDFILADAKDADMAFGLAAPGVAAGGQPGNGPFRSIAEFRSHIRELVAEGLVDVMLMSASTSDVLAMEEGLFADSPVTPAVRMNDTTDIWLAAGTTHDAFSLIEESKRHGARVALFGRKINAAEHQLEFVRHLRAVADEQLAAAEGVRSYHGALARLGIRPHRPLDDDLAITHTAAAYGG